MCSIGEDDFGDEGGVHSMHQENGHLEELPKGICKKCNENEIAVKLNKREPECEDCFLNYVRHKFRATLGSSKILPRDADVLVVFDGSPESYVLTDMVQYAVNQNNYKRLRCKPKILYIDETFLECSKSDIRTVKETLSQYEIDAYEMCISSEKPPTKIEQAERETSLFEKKIFKEHLGSMKSRTSQQDYLAKVRYNRIRSAAHNLGCRFVLLPDITTTLATNLLCGVILGRGGSVAWDVSLVDDRVRDLKLLRPIKDLSEREVDAYIKLRDLKLHGSSNQKRDVELSSSLQNLTEAFVRNLQINFPSTVSTVFRTGEKLSTRKTLELENSVNQVNAMDICSFCCSLLDYSDAKTIFATEFSRLASLNASDKVDDLEALEKQAKAQVEEHSTVFRDLCHGCRNIYRDFPNSGQFDPCK